MLVYFLFHCVQVLVIVFVSVVDKLQLLAIIKQTYFRCFIKSNKKISSWSQNSVMNMVLFWLNLEFEIVCYSVCNSVQKKIGMSSENIQMQIIS